MKPLYENLVLPYYSDILNKTESGTVRQAQLLDGNTVSKGRESILFYQLVFQRVRYFAYSFNFYGLSNQLRKILRLLVIQCVGNGRIYVYMKDNRLEAISIDKFTEKTVEGMSLNVYDFTDFKSEKIELKQGEGIEFSFNALNFGIGVVTSSYLKEVENLIDLLMKQISGKSLKLGAYIPEDRLQELRINLLQQLTDGNPIVALPDDITISKLDLPEVDLNEYFALIKNYLNFFDDIIGIKTPELLNDKARDLQAEQSTHAYRNDVAFNEGKENLELFVEELNEMLGTSITLEEVEEDTTYSAKVEKENADE